MPKALHEPFEDIGDQRSAEEAGIWIFLASEVIFFGGLFLGYAVYRVRYPEGFAAAGAETNLALGIANTALLLTSSATMAFTVGAGRKGSVRAVIGGLLATLSLGVGFLAVKAFEYVEDVRHHLIPGHPDFPVETFGADMFFSFYWGMTALHGVHMAIGLGVIWWTVLAVRRDLIAWRETAHLHVLGLYWNLVDVVWIFLFPLLYLVGR
jgi:cytochrome c oxidase subunit III